MPADELSALSALRTRDAVSALRTCDALHSLHIITIHDDGKYKNHMDND